MKKTTKGAIAAGGAAVLLLGGAGTLAYWTDSQTVPGGSFSTGSLGLGAPSCSGWTYTSTNAAATTLVPGDQVAEDCSFVITASGDHLSAALTTPNNLTLPAPAGTTTWSATVNTTYQLNGGAVTEVTSANDGQTLVAHIVVTFPFGDATTVNANDTQLKTSTLDDLTVTLTQDQTTGNNPN
ncbi:MAG TPA: alternate-type signal peptide domain-containing protein [Nocardioides sp.]|nr:alternate-type signal peptide domain-containing protein [Nocardioides sp.]